MLQLLPFLEDLRAESAVPHQGALPADRLAGIAPALGDHAEPHRETEFGPVRDQRLDDGWQLRASYGTGVKNPTFVERYGYYETGGPLFIGNPDLKPESSKSWEIGTTLKTRNNFFQLDLTYFNARLEDEINGYYYDAELGATTATNMDGTSKRDGVELSSWFNFSIS